MKREFEKAPFVLRNPGFQIYHATYPIRTRHPSSRPIVPGQTGFLDGFWVGFGLRLLVQEEMVVSFNNSRVQNPRIQLLSINRQNLNPRDKHDFLNF